MFNPSLFQSFQTIHECLKNSVTGIGSSRSRIRRSFNSLKPNKSPGFHNISSSVVTFCASGIFTPLKHIFNLSLQTGIFLNGMKIARVSPIFKKGEEFFFTNYRPISVLPYFSKLLERLMYNRLYKYLLQKIFSMKNNLDFRLQIQRNMRLYS